MTKTSRDDFSPADIASPASTIKPPPDGGRKAWMQSVMGHLVCFNTWGYLASFGVFQSYYQNHLGVSESAISWVGSIQIFLIFFVGTFSGRALDAGLFRPVFCAGVVLQVVGVFMTSLSSRYWQVFLAQGLCTGLGSGLQFCPTMGLVATYFDQRRVFAVAFALVGSGTGGMLFPGLVKGLLPSLGFGWTMRVVGFVMLATSLPSMALLQTRLPPRKSGPLVDLAAFRDPLYTLFIVGIWLNFWGMYFAVYYLGAFGRSVIGLSYSESTNLIIVLNGAAVVGRLIPAYLASFHLGPLNTIIPLGVAAGVLMLCWAAVDSSAGLYVFAVLYGFCANGLQGMWPPTLSSLITDLSRAGTRIGMGFTIVSFACLTGPPLGGALVAKAHGYIGAQMWAGVSILLGALVLLAARTAKVGRRIQVKV
ncbi:monocarboxylate permease [Aspergillus sclerotioniger CBS 115572]|uniref:Monocarboxylate permease n=1 Tax=Aspergillus sclerotioniger CBS 115572 TaxID=1450535 RepID=A0A317XEM1_9EURO|nr:monocarboxylate permease [Aspergillus sclerotioniger CBS 115572]PWY96107.1 monocarboxylate permease [Aspergillus sclerotioniger CBS 115572]